MTARYFPAVIQAGTAESEHFEVVRTELYGLYQPADPIEEMMTEKVTNKLARYQAAINRQLLEAMRELERLQAQRKAKEEKVRKSDGSSN